MYKRIVFISLLLVSIATKAHQADVSTTMLVERENNTWVLQISASLTAFQHEVRTHFSETPYKSTEEFQKMVLEHIKNNLQISFNNGTPISFGNGIVKLGHETKVVFEVFDIPSDINSVLVKNSAFKDIHKNQSALMLFKKGFSKKHFVLNNSNNHTLVLEVRDHEFVEVGQNEAGLFSSGIKFIIVGLGVVMLGVGYLFMKINRPKKMSFTVVS
ncbi:MAG: DUF6702 family protein [Flavobacteriales bacterium]